VYRALIALGIEAVLQTDNPDGTRILQVGLHQLQTLLPPALSDGPSTSKGCDADSKQCAQPGLGQWSVIMKYSI